MMSMVMTRIVKMVSMFNKHTHTHQYLFCTAGDFIISDDNDGDDEDDCLNDHGVRLNIFTNLLIVR